MNRLMLAVVSCVLVGACAEVASVEPSAPPIDLPDNVSDWVYVSEGASATGAEGTESKPYPTIQAGIDAASAGAAIIIGSGHYEESLVIDKSVLLFGIASVEQGVYLVGTSDTAITIGGGADVRIQDLHVTGGKNEILHATGEGTAVDLRDLTLVCGETEAGDGNGIVAREGAEVSFDLGTLTGCPAHGVLVHDASLVLDMVTLSGHGAGAVRLEGAREGTAILGSIIEDNQGFGVGLFCGHLALVQNVIQRTSTPGGGDGVVASVLTDLSPDDPLDGCSAFLTVGGADLAQGNEIRNNHRAGVLIEGSVSAWIEENTVEQNGNGGVWVTHTGLSEDVEVHIVSNRFLDNVHVGVGVAAKGQADVAGNLVLRTQPVEAWSGETSHGDGVFVSEAKARVYGNTVEQNVRYGVLVTDAIQGACLGDDNSFEDNMVSYRWQGLVQITPCDVTWTTSGEDDAPNCPPASTCGNRKEPTEEEGTLLDCDSPTCVANATATGCPAECFTDHPGGGYAYGLDCTGCFDDDPETLCPNDDPLHRDAESPPCCPSNNMDGLTLSEVSESTDDDGEASSGR